MSIKNEYHLRTVADNAGKACYICYKPSTKVLITPDNKDFFYVCSGHLTDKGFCSPLVDPEVEAAKKKQEDLDRQIAQVTKEYEERQRRRKEKAKDKASKSTDDDKDKKGSKEDENRDDLEKEKNEKIKNLKAVQDSKPAEEHRIFTLHRNFYQMRLDRIRNMQAAQKNRERLKDPSFFPSAPKGDL